MSGNIRQYQIFINGKWVDARSGETFGSVNPYTGKVWAEVPAGDAQDINDAVRAARAAFNGPWSEMLPRERGNLLRRLGDLIRENADELARIETTDNGKLIREMSGQLKVLPEWYYYFAGICDKIQGEVIPVEKPNILNYTLREPLGVVGIITPWNSPLLLMSMSLVPALAAGNTAVIKPAEQAPVSTLEFARLVEGAGIPSGVVNIVTGFGETAGEALAKHPDLDKLAFTGGTDTGRRVAQNAADHLTPVLLELGGKSPQIVFEDAHIDNAINGVTAGIFAATGQTCVAGSRLFVHKAIADEFLQKLADRAQKIKLGDPLEMATEMAPVAFKAQLEKIQRYVEIGLQEGAELVCGGKQPTDPALAGGLFFEPTIFTNVRNDMKIAQDEIFGPVLCSMTFEEENEAVDLANNTRYGLAAGIWTQDVQRAHRVAQRLKAGTVWINTFRSVSYASPFGGYKMSGFGRTNGFEAMKEYTQVKSVWVELSGVVPDPFRLA